MERKNRELILGIYLLTLLLILVFIVPIFLSTDFVKVDLAQIRQAPSFSHLFGTDNLGRDLFVRVLLGGRISIAVGVLATAISVSIGFLYGSIAGFAGGTVDEVMMRIVDMIMSFPAFFLILAIMSGARNTSASITLVILVIGLTSWTGLARLVRGEILSLREREFVLVEIQMGLSRLKIIIKHLLPNMVSILAVYSMLSVAGAMLTEAALSYFGLGVQPPVPSWGNILREGQGIYILKAFWISFFPGLLIFLTVLSFNLIGNGIQETGEK